MAGETWIWLAEREPLVNAYADFLCDVALQGRDAQLLISAGSHYAVWLNGRRVPASQYADYPGDKVMDCIDLAPWAQPGVNRLAIQAYCQGESSFVYRKGPAALWFRVQSGGRTVAESGTGVRCRRSLEYVSGPVEKLTPQLSFSFRADLAARDGWQQPGYDASGAGWQDAVRLTYHPALRPRPVERLLEERPAPALLAAQGACAFPCDQAPVGDRMQTAAMAFRPLHQMAGRPMDAPAPIAPDGLTLSVPAPGLWATVDLGCERAGLLWLDVSVPEPCELLIGYGEHLDDQRVRTSVGGRQFACSVRVPAGRSRFLHPFKRFAGRYLTLMAPLGTLTLHGLSLQETPYPVRALPQLALPDHLDQRIRDVSIRTLRLCMHEHYEDCPWREQALYAMDSRLQMLSGYYAFRGGAFARASLELLAKGQQPCGLLEICAPAEGEITIPSFSLAFVLAMQDYLAYTGDRAFAEGMLPVMARILQWFLGLPDGEGLLRVTRAPGLWHFYEWQDGLDGRHLAGPGADCAYEAPLQALCCMALDAMAAMSGDGAWRARADALRRGLERFYDPDAGAYRTRLACGGAPPAPHYAELTQALALLAGACPESRARALRERLRQPDGRLIPTSLAYRFYKYEALLGDPGNLDHVIADIRAVWGRMLAAGATSFWETERGAWDFQNAGSLCHGWSAIPVYFYGKYLLKIEDPQR